MLFEQDFQRYLSAKKSVDDRALNRNVWDKLQAELEKVDTDSISIFEIGAGIGTMLERVLEWELTSKPFRYVAVDSNLENILYLPDRIANWCGQNSVGFERVGEHQFSLRRQGQVVELELIAGDVFEVVNNFPDRGNFDLLIAHAFLDLVDIPSALPKLFPVLVPGGLYYFTITFDGVTSFEPVVYGDVDKLIEEIYHHTMDDRVLDDGLSSGDRYSGRRLYQYIRQSGASVLEMRSSDWVVFPSLDGVYQADEEYFLSFILDTVFQAVRGDREIKPEVLNEWLVRRQEQVKKGELVYMAHQLDYVGKV